MKVWFRHSLPLLGFAAFAMQAYAEDPAYITLNKEGAELVARNRLADAKSKFDAARAACGECTELPGILNNLAVLARRKGANAEAVAIYSQALALRERREGADAISLLGLLNNLSIAQREAGQLKPALLAAQRAMKLVEMHHAENTAAGADAYANLGNILANLGDMAQGKALLERALSARRALFGGTDPLVGETLNDLAVVYRQSGDLIAAADLTNRAVTIFSGAPQVAPTLLPVAENNLGRILMAQRRWKEAEHSFRQAIADARKRMGPEDPLVAVGMTNLASLLGERHQFREAEKLMADALAIDRRAFSPRHARVAYDMSTEGLIAFERRDYAHAELLFMEAANILSAIHPPTHPEVGRISANLGEVYLKQHRNADAERAFGAASVAMEATFGAESPQLLAVLQSYSLALRAQQKFAEAAAVDARATRIEVKMALQQHDPAKGAGRGPVALTE